MPGAPAAALVRLRIAISVFFALDGFLFAGWVVRIPAIKDQTSASASALGLALLGVPVGSVTTMLLTGRLCRRYGSHSVTVACATSMALSINLPPLTHSAALLGLTLLVFGAAYGGLTVAFNAAAVDIVAAYGRPIMPTFHAAFSAGGLIGSGLGALLAPHLGPQPHLAVLSLLGLAVTALAGPALIRTAPPTVVRADPAPTDGGPAGQRGQVRLLVGAFGLIALCTAYGEGAMADWGALHIRQDLGTGAATAAAGYTVFSFAMMSARIVGARVLEWLGPGAVVCAGGLAATAGMLLGALAPELWLVACGYALTGLGLANIFPIAVAGAGRLSGAQGVAVASTLGYLGFLLGPPAIGLLADAFGLPHALTTVVALAAVAALLGATVMRSAR
ncbi:MULTISPECIES: MFS transporter [unclassified Streptomyces]|uniref:MFS transporter n=1 Tax=unclassified Streptomyces TaxID=2593676 RepID=UPI0038000E47